MISIKIIALGAMKDHYIKLGITEYLKRLQSFCKCEIVEIPEGKSSQNPNDSEIKQLLAEEASRLEQAIPKDAYVIAMAVEGVQLSSEEFAQKIESITTYETNKIVFLIGSSHGLDSQIKTKAHLRLSLSKVTFPHTLLRLILLEQVYRALSIIHHTPYHK